MNISDIEISEAFPESVVKISVLLSLFIALIILGFGSYLIAISFIVGALISVLLFHVLSWSIKRFIMFNSSKKGSYKRFLGVLIIKYTLLAISIYCLFNYTDINLIAFSVGIGIIQMVVLLKTAGLIIFSTTATASIANHGRGKKINKAGVT